MDATWRRLSSLDRSLKRGKRQANVDRAADCIADHPSRPSVEDHRNIDKAINDGDVREIAVALNLAPCFTPVESPESNGMAEAFVKTFKRDYVRVSPIANAAEAESSSKRRSPDSTIVADPENASRLVSDAVAEPLGRRLKP